MNKTKSKGSFASFSLHILGFALCIIPPTACTLAYFPLWRSAGFSSCIAGGSALLLIICFFPLLKFLTRAIQSYGSHFVWLLCFILFLALSKIAEQMIVISLFGFIGNLLGEVCFFIAKRRRNE